MSGSEAVILSVRPAIATTLDRQADTGRIRAGRHGCSPDLLFPFRVDRTLRRRPPAFLQGGRRSRRGACRPSCLGVEHGRKHRRIFSKFIPLKNDERIAPEQIGGDPDLPLETIVTEAGMRFGLDFAAGYSAGLFIDQRANRAFVRQRPRRRLLNTFAYTCSFSVVAALAGAETVSIDLSKKSLDRGRANFALNVSIPRAPPLPRRRRARRAAAPRPPRRNIRRHHSRPADFLTRQQRPPLPGRARLRSAARRRARSRRPRRALLLSTNCTRLTRRELERIARFALKFERRAADFHTEPELPDIPRDFGAQTLWLTLK